MAIQCGTELSDVSSSDVTAHTSYREAQADGEYAEALARCGAAAAALDAVQGLAVADALASSVDELAADTAVQLASALQAVCTDFDGSHFMRVGADRSFPAWYEPGAERCGAAELVMLQPFIRFRWAALHVGRGVLCRRALNTYASHVAECDMGDAEKMGELATDAAMQLQSALQPVYNGS